MAQLQKGTTYTTGGSVTASNLNAHVDSAILLDGAVSAQTALGASPASDDLVLLSDTDASTLKSATTTELLATELAAWVGKGASGGTAALQIDGVDKLSIDSSGNTTVAGTTTMTGAATASSTLGVTGVTTLSTLGVTGVTTLSDHLNLLTNKEARFQDAADNEYVGLKAPTTVSASYTLTLPGAVGGDNQVLQTADASGTLEWVDPVTPSDKQVQTSYYTATGSSTFTVPAGVTKVRAKAWGAGGGLKTSHNNGGGQGGYCEKLWTVVGGEDITIAVGAAGPDNTAGGDTTVTYDSSTITAGGGGVGAGSSNFPGAGGSASGGDWNMPGAYGNYSEKKTTGGQHPGAGAGTSYGATDGGVILEYIS